MPLLKSEAIVASNTSSISITRLAAATDRPDRFIGMHFMNPVPVMALVELIRGIATDERTFGAIRDLAVKLGKTPVAAEDFPAFIVNRILLPMINEAVYTLYEGVGSVEAIDIAMKLGANHPMGPLELADFIGLDTCLSVMQVLYEGLAEFEIPALSAAGEIRRGGLARPQDQPRLLRLSRREAGADALDRPSTDRSRPAAILWQHLAAYYNGMTVLADRSGAAFTFCGALRPSVAGCGRREVLVAMRSVVVVVAR